MSGAAARGAGEPVLLGTGVVGGFGLAVPTGEVSPTSGSGGVMVGTGACFGAAARFFAARLRGLDGALRAGAFVAALAGAGGSGASGAEGPRAGSGAEGGATGSSPAASGTVSGAGIGSGVAPGGGGGGGGRGGRSSTDVGTDSVDGTAGRGGTGGTDDEGPSRSKRRSSGIVGLSAEVVSGERARTRRPHLTGPGHAHPAAAPHARPEVEGSLTLGEA